MRIKEKQIWGLFQVWHVVWSSASSLLLQLIVTTVIPCYKTSTSTKYLINLGAKFCTKLPRCHLLTQMTKEELPMSLGSVWPSGSNLTNQCTTLEYGNQTGPPIVKINISMKKDPMNTEFTQEQNAEYQLKEKRRFFPPWVTTVIVSWKGKNGECTLYDMNASIPILLLELSNNAYRRRD